MSFTASVKSEVAANELKECCAKAQCSALIKMCSSLNINAQGMYLTIQSESAPTAKKILKLLKEHYQIQSELSVLKKMNLKKNNIYVLRIYDYTQEILRDLEIMDKNGLRSHPSAKLVNKDCCAKAFLAGAFLAGGSVNSPNKTNYHLEIATTDENLAKFIQKLMERFYLPAKIITRRNQQVVYLKSSEKIADFLKCIEATSSVFEYEDIRIQRDFMNSLTRLDNCDFANEMKTLAAGRKQCEDIEYLENYGALEFLPTKIKQVALLRKKYPEASLNELCEHYEEEYYETISKSGMRHRLNKMKEIAATYKKQEN